MPGKAARATGHKPGDLPSGLELLIRAGCLGLGGMMDSETRPVELLVCVKCKRGADVTEDGERPGQRLYEELRAGGMPEGVTLTAVECLQNCDHGCSVAMRGGDARWTYVYGNLDEGSHRDLLADGMALYRDANDGVIPWRQRPEHFKRNCIARIPPVAAGAPKLGG